MNEQLIKLWARRLVPTLSLLATCLGYLQSHHYPLLTEEVFILLAGACVLGAGIGYALEWAPDWFTALVFGALIVLAAVLISNVLTWIDGNVISNNTLRRIFKLLMFVVLPLGLAVAMRRDIALILGGALIVFIVGILAFPQREVFVWGRDAPSPKPPHRLVLHIIFDEFAGNAGIGTTFPEGNRLRRDVSTFFTHRGFRLYEGAFSAYPHTDLSLSALFSLARPMPKDMPRYGHPYAWFEKLHDGGYRIIYIGNEFVPVCRDPEDVKRMERCVLYPAMNLGIIRVSNISPLQKAYAIGELALKKVPYFFQLVRYRRTRAITGWGGTLRPLEDAKATLLHDGGDVALVLHVLLPHSAIVYDENCAWHSEQAFLVNASWHGAQRQVYERAYADQVRCTLKQLDTLLQIVDRRWPDAVVIVHGDHGLRLEPFTTSREDVRLRHAVLFAVRAKSVKPGVEPQDENLQMLFARYAAGRQISNSRLLYGDDLWDSNKALEYPQ